MAPCSPGGGDGIFISKAGKAVSDIFRGSKKKCRVEMENNERKQKNL